MHMVLLVDVALGISRLGRDLMLAGASADRRGSNRQAALRSARMLRQAISRFAASNATVDVCTRGGGGADNILALLESGVTGIVCGSQAAARQIRADLEKAGVSVPAQVSLAAVGFVADAPRAAAISAQWRNWRRP